MARHTAKNARRKLLETSVLHRIQLMGQIIQRVRRKLENSNSANRIRRSLRRRPASQVGSQHTVTVSDMLADPEQAVSFIKRLSEESVDLSSIAEDIDKKGLAQAACLTDKEEVLTITLNLGADFNFADSKGYSPLHLSAAWGWYNSVMFIVENTAADVFQVCHCR